MNDTVDVDKVLEEAAQATAAAGRKPRVPKGDATPREPKAQKAPKLYPQWNEDGSPLLDSDGNQVMLETKMAKPRKAKEPKAPKLDADGNPIVRSRVLPTNANATITWNEEKVSTYKGARGDMAAMRTSGQTIAEYLAAGGDKGFLSFYVRDGAATCETPSE